MPLLILSLIAYILASPNLSYANKVESNIILLNSNPSNSLATNTTVDPKLNKLFVQKISDNDLPKKQSQSSKPLIVNDSFQARALISPKDSVVITAQIDGEIIETPFLEGDRFKKGDSLLKFNCRLYELDQQRALSNYNTQKSTRQNVEKLIKSRSASTLELQFAKANEDVAKVEHEISKLSAENCNVKAPYAGKVSQLGVTKFEFVSRGTQIIEIINDEELQIKLIVPSLALRWLKVGYNFKILIDETGKEHPATVSKIASSIDPVSQTVSVTGKFVESNEEIIPGMSGIATFDK